MTISDFIDILVMICGFGATIYFNKKNLENEMKRRKSDKSLEKMEDVPYEILNLLDDII